VRTRIVTLAVVAAMLAIVLFGLPLAAGTAHYLFSEEHSHLEQRASSIAGEVADDLANGRVPGRPMHAKGDTSVAVYSYNRRRTAGIGPDELDDELGQALQGRVEFGRADGQITAAVPVTEGQQLVGAVRTSSPESEVYQQLGLIWVGMLALAAVSVGAVWLVARWQARRLSAPLSAMAASAGRLGEGDFTIRAERVDIPEIDSLGQALNTTAERLDDMLARERAFSAEASHQLRTPLTGLRLRLEAALGLSPDELRAAVTAAIGDTDRVERTIDELLTLARRDGAGGSEPLALHGLLEETHQAWSHRPGVDQRSLVIDVEPDLPDSPASTAAIRQVLNVLLDNAAAHGTGTVTVTARDAGQALAIDVADEGDGVHVPESEIFVRGTPNTKGHGIGLALARRLAEAEGGRLRMTRPTPPIFTILVPVLSHPSPHDADADARPTDKARTR
jgi:signal transduction histidine kinase